MIAVVGACSQASQESGAALDASDPTVQCSETRPLVVFDFFHMLTTGPADDEVHEALHWLAGPEHEPRVRPGAAQLVREYQDAGYEIVYVHLAPAELSIGEAQQPIDEAILGWLRHHQFPSGEGVQLLSWPGEEHGSADTDQWDTGRLQVLSNELLEMKLDELDLAFGYTGITARAEAFINGGVARVFTIGEATGVERGTPVPDDDLSVHVETVRALAEPICPTT